MQKSLPILFFYSIKFRGYAHYANACINFKVTHDSVIGNKDLYGVNDKEYIGVQIDFRFGGLQESMQFVLRAPFRKTVLDYFFSQGPRFGSVTVTEVGILSCYLFVGVTYETGSGRIRICNYFLYGFRKWCAEAVTRNTFDCTERLRDSGFSNAAVIE